VKGFGLDNAVPLTLTNAVSPAPRFPVAIGPEFSIMPESEGVADHASVPPPLFFTVRVSLTVPLRHE
jgi:hypothetical protein